MQLSGYVSFILCIGTFSSFRPKCISITVYLTNLLGVTCSVEKRLARGLLCIRKKHSHNTHRHVTHETIRNLQCGVSTVWLYSFLKKKHGRKYPSTEAVFRTAKPVVSSGQKEGFYKSSLLIGSTVWTRAFHQKTHRLLKKEPK